MHLILNKNKEPINPIMTKIMILGDFSKVMKIRKAFQTILFAL